MNNHIEEKVDAVLMERAHIALALELPAEVYDDYTKWLRAAFTSLLQQQKEEMMGKIEILKFTNPEGTVWFREDEERHYTDKFTADWNNKIVNEVLAIIRKEE